MELSIEPADLEAFASNLGRGMLAAYLLGWAQVSRETGIVAPVGLSLADDWTPVPPDEAIAYARGLVPVTDSAYKALDQKMRKAALSIARVESRGVVDAAREGIVEALKTGGTSRDFRKYINEACDREGITRLSKWHAELVFHQNMSTTLAAGRMDAQRSPAVMEALPWWRYSAVGDDRSRPEHMRLHGFTARADDVIWDSIYPPNGYACRCWVTAERTGEQSPLPDISIPEGFSHAPGAFIDKLAA